ncbi:MAG: adenylosuccinate lyase, partial [Candidatus Heimdallarchaeota archaeon]
SPILENIVTWHERDLANSANERYIYPEVFLTIDQILNDFDFVVSGLIIREDRIKQNLEMSKGLVMAEAIMTQIVKNGMNRQEAHEVLRKNSMESFEKDKNLFDVLKKDTTVTKFIAEKDLKEIFDNPQNYLGTAREQVEIVILAAKKAITK